MIIIEGQIGAGKTTLGELLEKKMKVPLYRELEQGDAAQILNNFYKDKFRWSFLSQVYFLTHRFNMIANRNHHHGMYFLDRSMFGDSIFAELLYETGCMSKEEYNTYTTLLYNLMQFAGIPKFLIYLDCSVDEAAKRVMIRDRKFEKEISYDYLEKIHEKYRVWYNNYNFSEKIFIDTEKIDIRTSAGASFIIEQISKYM